MKLGSTKLLAILGLLFISACDAPARPTSGPAITAGLVNPDRPLAASDSPGTFRFVIMADRTGGERRGVFESGIEKVNLLRPDFVMTVGDLIEGYIDRPDRTPWDTQVAELKASVGKLEAPMFYTVGNHDISNEAQSKLWIKEWGQPYYHFTYKGALFLVAWTQPSPEPFGDEQLECFSRAIAANRDARWTLLFLHHPVWTTPKVPPSWAKLESMLPEKATIFAGHHHRYVRIQREGRWVYQLATTGGASGLDPGKGQFDHLMWVTVTPEGPVIANLMLDGIHSDLPRFPSTRPVISPAITRPSTRSASTNAAP